MKSCFMFMSLPSNLHTLPECSCLCVWMFDLAYILLWMAQESVAARWGAHRSPESQVYNPDIPSWGLAQDEHWNHVQCQEGLQWGIQLQRFRGSLCPSVLCWVEGKWIMTAQPCTWKFRNVLGPFLQTLCNIMCR